MQYEMTITSPIQELGVVGNWWRAQMKSVSQTSTYDPNYFATTPEILQSEAQCNSFVVGNGHDIYTRHICPAIEQAREEIVLITCFWARSSSLNAVSRALRRLSDCITAEGRRRVRVFIGFSSLSLVQKLFHTFSLHGRSYPPSQWTSRLGLPSQLDLPGLDLQIKSIFVLPFSVMHPKFVIVDRKLVFLPSCNVSWESWFEGCLSLSGPIVQQFVDFWEHFWLRSDRMASLAENGNRASHTSSTLSIARAYTPADSEYGPAHAEVDLSRQLAQCYALFLPSPHHMNPNLRFPWQKCAIAPSTPLNTFLLEVIGSATSSVYMQTPNITSPPVLQLLLKILRCGTHVHILTSERLMILEQLVTAGTTTSRCVKKLIKLYKRSRSSPRWSDEEMGGMTLGQLKIEYYQPMPERQRREGEPVQSHLKLTIVDGQWTVLGSGNMDRASWYTSQELGVAFHSEDLAAEVKRVVDAQMVGRTKIAFDSTRL